MGKKLSDRTLEELWELFPITLTAPQERWADEYRGMEALLHDGLAGVRLVRISHIGSTAIRGIWAKPIVDILVEVARCEDLAAVAGAIERLGFIRMSPFSFNRGYTEAGFAEQVYHLHLRYEGDNDELYFRDYLNEHPPLAKEYEALKLRLWAKYEHDRDAYTEAKSDFVKRWTAAARDEYGRRWQ